MVAMSGAARAFLVAAAGAAAVISAPASAATYYNYFNGTTGTYGDSNVTPAGSFAQLFTFVLGSSGSVASTITSSNTSAATNIDFTRVRLTGPAGFLADYVPVATGKYEFRTFDGSKLAAGTYTLDVRGTSGGAASYTGDFNFTAGVPEPATWALMILGFGAVGGAMRRRQSVAAKVRFA